MFKRLAILRLVHVGSIKANSTQFCRVDGRYIQYCSVSFSGTAGERCSLSVSIPAQLSNSESRTPQSTMSTISCNYLSHRAHFITHLTPYLNCARFASRCKMSIWALTRQTAESPSCFGEDEV